MEGRDDDPGASAGGRDAALFHRHGLVSSWLVSNCGCDLQHFFITAYVLVPMKKQQRPPFCME